MPGFKALFKDDYPHLFGKPSKRFTKLKILWWQIVQWKRKRLITAEDVMRFYGAHTKHSQAWVRGQILYQKYFIKLEGDDK